MDHYTPANKSDIERTYVPPKQFMQFFTLWGAVKLPIYYLFSNTFIVQVGKNLLVKNIYYSNDFGKLRELYCFTARIHLLVKLLYCVLLA